MLKVICWAGFRFADRTGLYVFMEKKRWLKLPPSLQQVLQRHFHSKQFSGWINQLPLLANISKNPQRSSFSCNFIGSQNFQELIWIQIHSTVIIITTISCQLLTNFMPVWGEMVPGCKVFFLWGLFFRKPVKEVQESHVIRDEHYLELRDKLRRMPLI